MVMVSTFDFFAEKESKFLCILGCMGEFFSKADFFLEQHATTQKPLTSFLGTEIPSNNMPALFLLISQSGRERALLSQAQELGMAVMWAERAP